MDSKTVKEDDLEIVFMHRKVRIGITKPYFPSGTHPSSSEQVRSVGVINEDGVWVGPLVVDLAEALEAVRQLAISHVDERYKATGFRHSSYNSWVRTTNSSRDKNNLQQVRNLVHSARTALEDAQQHASSITDPELSREAQSIIDNVEGTN